MNAKYNKILNTTISLFIKNGIKKTTMDELAESANVSKVTIYKYFGDKDALYYTVGKYILSECSKELQNQLDITNDINTKLNNIMDILSELIITKKLTLCKELARLNDALQSEYNEFDSYYKDIIMSLVSDGKKMSIVRNDIDDDYIFHYIDMGLTYFESNTRYRDKIINDKVFKTEFMEFLLSNIYVK